MKYGAWSIVHPDELDLELETLEWDQKALEKEEEEEAYED